MKIERCVLTIIFISLFVLNSISQNLNSKDSSCVGIVGIHVGEGYTYEGVVYKDKDDKSSVIKILLSTMSNDDNDSTYIYNNGSMNFVYEYAQFYCIEVDKKWCKIYIDAPINTYVWVKKKKRFVTYYNLDEITQLQKDRKKPIISPCGSGRVPK